jgi:hypothetical protein
VAINLLGSGNDRIDFGDIAALGGLTEVSLFVIVKLTANPVDGTRIVSQWGNAGVEQNFVIQLTDTNELGVAFQRNGGYFGKKTSTLDLANGGTYRILVTFVFITQTMHIWVNGVDMALSAFVGSDGGVTVMADATSSVQYGHESDEIADGQDGDYAEAAIWSRALTGAEAALLTTDNKYPTCVASTGQLLYCPFATTTDLTNQWGVGGTASLTGGTNASHPTMVACAGAAETFGYLKRNALRPRVFRPGMAR